MYENKQYKVLSINVLNNQIKIEDNGNILFVDVKDIQMVNNGKQRSH